MRSTSSRLRSCTIHSYLRPDVRDPKRGAQGSNFDLGVGRGEGDGNERMSFARAFSVKTKPHRLSRTSPVSGHARGERHTKVGVVPPRSLTAPRATRLSRQATRTLKSLSANTHLELLSLGQRVVLDGARSAALPGRRPRRLGRAIRAKDIRASPWDEKRKTSR